VATSRLPWLTASLTLTAVAVSNLPRWSNALMLDPSQGLTSLPRWLSGHLVHHTPEHLLWDVLAFAVLGAWLEVRSRAVVLWVMGAAAVAVSAWMALTLPTGGVFGGLSGIDAALVGATVVAMSHSTDRVERGVAALLGAAFAAKLAMELWSGGVFLADGGGVIHVPMAHAIGAAVGAVVSWRWLSRSLPVGD
jgi:membrane associated rhomboid family serine protease